MSPVIGQVYPWEPNPVVQYWDVNINAMEFRQPIRVMPYDLKAGLMLYGGPEMFTGLPLGLLRNDDSVVLLDSTESEMGTVAAFYSRFSLVYDVEIFKINLRSRLIPVRVIDIMLGAGLRTNQIPFGPHLPSNWPEDGEAYRFAPVFHELLLNLTLSYQWSENRLAYLALTRGLGTGNAYRANLSERYLSGRANASDMAMGFKLLQESFGEGRLAIGGELRFMQLDVPRFDDPDDLTPIEGLQLRSLGLFLTLGISIGGELTIGDAGKEAFYAGNYIRAAENFQLFISRYPDHTGRNRAERFLAKSEELIPYQQVNLAESAQNDGRYSEALSWYNRAEGHAVENLTETIAAGRAEIGHAYLQRADSLLTLGRLDTTLQLLNVIGRLIPDEGPMVQRFQAEVLIRQGHLIRSAGGWSSALSRYDEALLLDGARRVEIEGYKARLAEDLLQEAGVAADRAALQLALESLRMSQSLDPGRKALIDDLVSRIESILEFETQVEVRQQIERQMDEFRTSREQGPGSEPRPGMLISPVEDLLGEPDYKTEETDRFGINHQLWEYGGGSYPGLYYFENYILVRIEALP
ncbi:tol-pal system YbgF family protein [Candidatus Neomarinimicrobiota bacterium]